MKVIIEQESYHEQILSNTKLIEQNKLEVIKELEIEDEKAKPEN
jgi:hypothetical protein